MRTAGPASILLILGALAAGGCGGGSSSPSAPKSPPTPAPPAAPAPLVRIVPAPADPPALVDPGLAVVRDYTRMFYEGEIAKLHEKFSAEMKETLPLERLELMREQVLENYGREIRVLGEETAEKGPYRGFQRWARFDKHDGVMEVQWILKKDDAIAGFHVRPAKPPS